MLLDPDPQFERVFRLVKDREVPVPHDLVRVVRKCKKQCGFPDVCQFDLYQGRSELKGGGLLLASVDDPHRELVRLFTKV